MVHTYQPLYLKYRPQSLADLVGQKSVDQTLSNAIEHDRISHAYLFTGPRGTGKTSSARILAKSLNCETGPTASPCLVCASCLEVKAGNSPSVFEIDAASNNSVDDARSLIERAPLVAQGGRYKLYIIDECHMLTKEAFNALLKTIEEPPPMVVFILATTEEHKVPPTIISRCQRLMFKLVNQKELTAHLRNISKLEEINIQDDALELIARRSGGGLRDALGLLDQASLLSTKEKAVGVNDLLILLGAVHEDVLLQISGAIRNRDGHAVLSAANTLLMEGREPAVLVLELAKHFLNLTKASYMNETGGVTAESLTSLVLGSPSYLQAIVAQAKTFDRAELALMVEYLDKLEQSCRRSSQPVLSVEMGLLALCHRHDMTFVRDLDARVKLIENVLGDEIARGPAVPSAARPTTLAPQTKLAQQAAPSPSYAPKPASQLSPPLVTPQVPAALVASHVPTASITSNAPAASVVAMQSALPSGSTPAPRPTADDLAPPIRVPSVQPERQETSHIPVQVAPKTTPKAPSPSSTFASKMNEAMAAAGLGTSSTAAKIANGKDLATVTTTTAISAQTPKVPPTAPPEDISYDDVEPEPSARSASPVVRPPAVEPTLEALEAQPDVVEEIDEYEILPRSTEPSLTDALAYSATPSPGSSADAEEEEEEEDGNKHPEPPLPLEEDDDDYDQPEKETNAVAPAIQRASAIGLSVAPTLGAAAAPAPTLGSAITPAVEPSSPKPGNSSAPDIDEFWSDVKEALQKRHIPTFSIVSTHAFPISFDNDDFLIGVRNETFQKTLENKLEHLKAAAAAVTGRAVFVRVKVIADSSPKPVGAAKTGQGSARPKETKSAPADSEEGESRDQQLPSTPPPRPALAPSQPRPIAPATPQEQGLNDASPVRTTHLMEVESRTGALSINEVYKLFEGQGSKIIG